MEVSQFTMSMYQNKEDLYRAKALYFEGLYDDSERKLKLLKEELEREQRKVKRGCNVAGVEFAEKYKPLNE